MTALVPVGLTMAVTSFVMSLIALAAIVPCGVLMAPAWHAAPVEGAADPHRCRSVTAVRRPR